MSAYKSKPAAPSDPALGSFAVGDSLFTRSFVASIFVRGLQLVFSLFFRKMDQDEGFLFGKKIVLRDLKPNTFDTLTDHIEFEDITKGRKGAVLVAVPIAAPNHEYRLVPIVRTTTAYTKPTQPFRGAHYELIDQIAAVAGTQRNHFNNAMIEIYDGSYRKMGFHTDQTLDLEPGSWICLFSCYENASKDPADIRKLVIQRKTDDSKQYSILLEHNSAVLFNVEANSRYVHKIILDGPGEAKNRWCGITMRMSKTVIAIAEKPRFASGEELRLATDAEKREFFQHKKRENETDGPYAYPDDLNYTISPSDLLPARTE